MKPLSLFAYFSAPACDGVASKRVALKVDVLKEQNKYRVRACVLLPARKKLLAGAVKGLTSIGTIRLIRDGEKGEGVWRWGKREIIYLSLHCHHQTDSCIKMGSDESYFNVSLIVRDKVTRQCPQITTFEEKGEPKRNRAEVPQLTSLTPYR